MNKVEATSSRETPHGLWAGFKQELGIHWVLICFTNLFAAAFGCAIVWLCWRFAYMTGRQPYEFLLVCMLGAVIGWVFGMFFAPYNLAEEKRFSNVAGALSAFISGYALSKLGKFIDTKIIALDKAEDFVWLMLGVFICSVFLAFLTVFCNRSYHGVAPKNNEVESDPKDQTQNLSNDGVSKDGPK